MLLRRLYCIRSGPDVADWTEADLSTLKDMAAQGASASRVAVRLRRSVKAVQKRAKEIGLTLKDAKAVRKSGGLEMTWGQNREV